MNLARTLHHLALLRVDAHEIGFHSGAYGPVQGWYWTRGVLRPEDHDALYDAMYGGLIVICAPAVADAEQSRSLPPRWLRLIPFGVPPVTGNAVRITGIGWTRLSKMNAASPVLAGAA
jgi:hypothetical protein